MTDPRSNLRRLLVAVAAHADDAELNAGGTMAKWITSGGRVAIVMVTNNCSGELIPGDGDESKLYRLPPEATSALRHQEQAAAAAMLGVQVHHLDYPQRHYFDGQRVVSLDHQGPPSPPATLLTRYPPLLIAFRQQAHVQRMRELLEQLQPALVLTQTPLDIDPEHHATASLVWQAMAGSASLPGTPLRFWSPGSSCPGGMFDPAYDVIEDITEHYETKLRLCAAHRSQMVQMRWKMVHERARHWGQKIGVRYAEPFKTAHRMNFA